MEAHDGSEHSSRKGSERGRFVDLVPAITTRMLVVDASAALTLISSVPLGKSVGVPFSVPRSRSRCRQVKALNRIVLLAPPVTCGRTAVVVPA